MEMINNIDKTLKDDMLSTIRGGSTESCFSIYAFQKLKEQLPDISELRHTLTSLSFIIEKTDKQKFEFCIFRLLCEYELEVRIPQCKGKSINNSRLDENMQLQRRIKYLENRCSEKRLKHYQTQDEVCEKKEAPLAKVKAMLAQKIEQSKLVNFHWRSV